MQDNEVRHKSSWRINYRYTFDVLLNGGSKEAEARMKEINEAYSQVMKLKQGGNKIYDICNQNRHNGHLCLCSFI